MLFDVVAVVASEEAVEILVKEAAAVNWVRDAFGHLKVIGYTASAQPLLDTAAIELDDGTITVDDNKGLRSFIAVAKNGRRWDRERNLRSIG